MPVALEQFVRQIADSGVIAPGKLEHFVPPKAHPKDAQELARQLVQSKQLTKYQAQEIYAGRAKSLILGNYTIVDKIGAGGMGQVFKAEHRRMHRVVAIKMLPKAVTKDALAVRRFQREVEAAAKLSHPNIVTAFDADEAGGTNFLVMEFVPGSDLSALVKKNGPFAIDKAVVYILQAARGLDYAHKHGVVHRDIKPANLLLNSEGTVKILDMGLARIDSDDDAATAAELTGTGAVLGTVDYMAPEQALSTHHADARADIYSLGCSLYYLISGHAAYDGDTLMAKLLAHRDRPIPTLGAEAPQELQAVFARMVAKKVADRYQTMSEVLAALEPFAAPAQSSASLQPSLGAGSSSDALKFLREATLNTIAEPKPATKAGLAASALRLAKGRNKRFVLGAVGAAFAGLTILAAVVFKMRTSDGTLVVTLNQPDATVQVLSEAGKIEITRPGEKGTLSIAVDPGKHRLRVEKDGFRFFVKDFTVEKGGTTEIAATLEPAIARANKDTSGATDRRVALWWLSQHRDLRSRGLLYLRVNGKEMGIWNIARDLPKGLPNEPFQILRLETNRATDRDLPDLGRLTALAELSLVGSHVTAEGVAALKKALPNCYVKWGAASNPALAAKAWNSPEFVKWANEVAAMPAERQVAEVAKKLQELNPAFSGLVAPTMENGKVTRLAFNTDKVADLSPLRALPKLKGVLCGGHFWHKGKLADLSPLAGMRLTELICKETQVADLSPLAGMPLTTLDIGDTRVSDLAPLQGMPLDSLQCYGIPLANLSQVGTLPLHHLNFGVTWISDLAPLRGMKLTTIECRDTKVADLTPLEGMTTLERLVAKHTSITAAGVAALQKALPNCKIEWDEGNAADKDAAAMLRWSSAVAAMPAAQQIDAVEGKLQEQNPGYAGDGKHVIRNGVVVEFQIISAAVGDISPLHPLSGLQSLRIYAGDKAGKIADLSPLKGMRLTAFACVAEKLRDLSPLKGAPLEDLDIGYNPLADLSPLSGMPLTSLRCGHTWITDLSPLKGMHLTKLYCNNTQVADLSPLAGMPLTELFIDGTKVSNLSPLAHMATLGELRMTKTKATAAGARALQTALPHCKIEWDGPAAANLPWNTPDFQHWVSGVGAMPAEQQVAAVAKKLQELNPGFDGEEAHTVEAGVVTAMDLLADNVTDISPVRALAGLKSLRCTCSIWDRSKRLHTLSNLSPLKGMGLTKLDIRCTNASDLSPLAGMKLTELGCQATPVSDLSPLKGMPLETLWCHDTIVSDLSPLQGMPLRTLLCSDTEVSDLSPLKSMPLARLGCFFTPVSDLSPLQGMRLAEIAMNPHYSALCLI